MENNRDRPNRLCPRKLPQYQQRRWLSALSTFGKHLQTLYSDVSRRISNASSPSPLPQLKKQKRKMSPEMCFAKKVKRCIAAYLRSLRAGAAKTRIIPRLSRDWLKLNENKKVFYMRDPFCIHLTIPDWSRPGQNR